MEKESNYAISLTNSLKEINKFIKGGDYSALEQHMTGYARHLIKFRRDFYIITLFSGKDYESNQTPTLDSTADNKHDNSALIEQLELLLTNLNIPRHRWGRYLNSQNTVYNLFCQLNADLEIKGNIQLHTLIKLIDKKKEADKRYILILGGGVFILSVLLMFSPALLGVIALAKLILASAIALPAMGLIYTVGEAAYLAYQNHFDQKRSLFNRLRDNSFLFLNTALNISAYAVWLAGGAIMTPVAAILFVVASVVEVIKEIFITAQDYIQYKTNSSSLVQDLNSQQEQARLEMAYYQHRNAAIIKTLGAVLLLGVVVAMNFVPGGIFVTLAAVAAMIVIHQVKKLILNYNENKMRDRLQSGLFRLEQEYEKENKMELVSDGLGITSSLEKDAIIQPENLSSEVEILVVKGALASESEIVQKEKPKKVSNYAIASDVFFFKHLIIDKEAAEAEISSSIKPK